MHKAWGPGADGQADDDLPTTFATLHAMCELTAIIEDYFVLAILTLSLFTAACVMSHKSGEIS